MLRRPTFLGISGLDWWERRQADAIDAIEASELADSNAIAKLQAQVRELSMALAATVTVLGEMAGLELPEVERRVIAEIDAMKPRPMPANVARPKKAPVPEVMVACDRCTKQVSSSHTTITATGTLCDACAGV